MSRTLYLRAPSHLAKQRFKEEPHSYRTKYMRDRDRILYSKAFRRLSGKTQVFLASYDDHARTRLTHSLEVVQLSRTVARELNLDQDLTEAIALGHDLGHTPFGHAGERTLNQIMNGCYEFSKDIIHDDYQKGFKHNFQGVRVALDLEEHPLNLTSHTIYGILNHTKLSWEKYDENNKVKLCNNYFNNNCIKIKGQCPNSGLQKVSFYTKYFIDSTFVFSKDWSFEAFIVELCDEIAQRHHDLEDSLLTKLLFPDDIIESNFFNVTKQTKFKKNTPSFISDIGRFIIDTYITDLINTSRENLLLFAKQYDIKNIEDFSNKYPKLNTCDVKNIISFSEELKQADKTLKELLKNRVLLSHQVQRMDGRANYIMRQLFKAYLTNPQQLPDKTIYTLYTNPMNMPFNFSEMNSRKNIRQIKPVTFNSYIASFRDRIDNDYNKTIFKQTLLRTITDYISGMTDKYAELEFHKLYGYSPNVI